MKQLQMDFHLRLAARGYYVSAAYHCIPTAVPGPSQNRACAINAHGSSSLPSLRSEQIHFSAIRSNFVSTSSLLLSTVRVSLTTVVLMWRPFLQRHYPPSPVLRRHPTPWVPFAFLPLLSVVRHTRFLARGPRASRVTAHSQCPTCHALRPRGSGY